MRKNFEIEDLTMQEPNSSMKQPQSVIFKVLSSDQWSIAQDQGEFHGAAIDLSDGYIHFSTPEQVRETVEKHFAGQADLVLVGVDPDKLGDDLKWEPSRGGALFPHLYSTLALDCVVSVDELKLGEDGRHIFPD